MRRFNVPRPLGAALDYLSGPTKQYFPEKERGWRRKGAGEAKGPEKERGRRNKGAGEGKGPEQQRGS